MSAVRNAAAMAAGVDRPSRRTSAQTSNAEMTLATSIVSLAWTSADVGPISPRQSE